MVSGRYLSGYLALREKAEGFLDLCFDAKRAPEITRSRSAVSVSTRVFSDRASTLLTVVTIGQLVPSELELCQQQHDDGWGALNVFTKASFDSGNELADYARLSILP